MLLSLISLLAATAVRASKHDTEQNVLGSVADYAPGFTFSIKTESSVSHPATDALVDVRILVSAPSRDKAVQLAQLEHDALRAYFDTFPTEKVFYDPREYDVMVFEEGDPKPWHIKDQLLESIDGDSPSPSVNYKAQQNLNRVLFQDLASLRSFVDAYADSTTVTIDYLSWSLGPAAKAAALRDLRHRTIREGPTAAADYVETLGPALSPRLVDITEESFYSETVDGRLRLWSRGTPSPKSNLQPPDIKSEMNLRYKFVLEL